MRWRRGRVRISGARPRRAGRRCRQYLANLFGLCGAFAHHAGGAGADRSELSAGLYARRNAGAGGLAPGQPRLDYFSDSWNQIATVSATARPGAVAPVGLSANAAYERDDAGQLSQRYEGWFVRGDVLKPISPYVAVTAGVGYERIESSQRDPEVDAAGRPLVDSRGRFITNPTGPRRIAYRTDGVYYDAGVIWRPDRRTSVEGHVGERYGSLSVTGLARYQASRDIVFQAALYDGIRPSGVSCATACPRCPPISSRRAMPLRSSSTAAPSRRAARRRADA